MITATNMPKAIIKDNASNTDTMITTLREVPAAGGYPSVL